MEELHSSICLTSVYATIAHMSGIETPEEIDKANPILTSLFEKKLKGKKVDRTVIYNPDAVGLWLYSNYTELFKDAVLSSDVALPIGSVMPSVTPVCFASMYTGVLPEKHGIKKYQKPVLKTDTVFDAFLRNGKKVAIVSTTGDSISKIFLERELDYFIYDTIDEVNSKALELIENDVHDLIVIYNGNYDSTMHKFGPEAEESLEALKANIEFYRVLIQKINSCWGKHDVFYGFCPDHGCHEIDGNCGSHGLDMPEDMNVIHFYAIKESKQ